MAIGQWDEEGKFWEADHGLLDGAQIAELARADESEPLRSPIPTRMMSNGAAQVQLVVEDEQVARPGYTADNMTKFRDKYAALGPAPSHTRYGWMRTRA